MHTIIAMIILMILHVQENGKYYIIQTKILMLDKIPNDFPFTVYLADCPANNIAQIQHDFALPTLIVPAVVCAVSTRDYIGDHEGTLTSAKQALGLTMGLSEGQKLVNIHVLGIHDNASLCRDGHKTNGSYKAIISVQTLTFYYFT